MVIIQLVSLDDHPTDFATNLLWYLQLGSVPPMGLIKVSQKIWSMLLSTDMTLI